MPKIIGVKFRTSPRVYYFAPNAGEEYKKGTTVVVETQRGTELGTVVLTEREVDESQIVAPLKPALRVATESELQAAAADNERKQEIIATAKQKVEARGLDMKIVDCEFTVDHGKLVLYFTAEQRVDFRDLVRDLASAFHMRIDLRQISAREECKIIGSLGACGLPCCCGRFESDAEHVSIKMAKNQNLALTPNKINGMCGRLLCCLSYENKTYEDIIRRMPKHGTIVTCPDGRKGSVVSVTPLTEKIRVRVGDDENFEFAEYSASELGFSRSDKNRDREGENQNKQRDGDNSQNGPRHGKNRHEPQHREHDGAPQQTAGENDEARRKKHNKNRHNKNRRDRAEGNGNGNKNANVERKPDGRDGN